MTITYVNDLRLSEMATGDNSGTWGNVTNTNLELVGDALGYGTEAITTNADTHASTVADGSADAARAMYIKYTGTLDSTCTITIGPNTISRVHIIENATSGSQSIIIKQGSGATVTIGTGAVKIVYLDGAGSGAAVTDALVDLDLTGTTTVATLTSSGAINVSGSSGSTFTSSSTHVMSLVSTEAGAGDGPRLVLQRDSATPADNDSLGIIEFYGENDADEAVEYARIYVYSTDVSDGTEDGALGLSTKIAGSVVNRLWMPSTETIFNENSADLDFRVESNGNANMLFVDGGNDRVGIGTASPSTPLHVVGNNGILVDTEGNGDGQIYFGGISGTDRSYIARSNDDLLMWNVSNGVIKFATNDTERLRIAADGAISTPTAGTSNVRLGVNAGDAIVSGTNYNVVIGDEAGTALNSGDNNVAVGYVSGASLTSGSLNTFVGSNAGVAAVGVNNNTAIGAYAFDAGTGADNTAVGSGALGGASNSGGENVAVGNDAGNAISSGQRNVIVGTLAGDALTTGQGNIAIGYDALGTEDTGSFNTAVGREALKVLNYDGNGFNVALGYYAGLSLTTGLKNTLLGTYAGDNITTEDFNTLIGYACGDALTTGKLNTAVGAHSLDADTKGWASTAVGYFALGAQTFTSSTVSENQSDNTAVGYFAGSLTTTGKKNTYIGSLAGDDCIDGNNNTAVGYNSLSADHGDHNTAVGHLAGLSVTSANNTLIGSRAGDALTIGELNTAVGDQALTTDDVGSRSVAVGYYALGAQNAPGGSTNNMKMTAVGYAAGSGITTGHTSTFLGYQAGDVNVDGNSNICIGADADTAATDTSSAICIGNSITASDNDFSFGKASNVVTNDFDTDANWTHSSDERLKKNITDQKLGLDFINDLRTVKYNWKPSTELDDKDTELNHLRLDKESNSVDHEDFDGTVVNNMNTTATMHNFIAQEVKTALDKAGVSDFSGWSEDRYGVQQVSREMFIIPLVKAMQELSAKVTSLEAEVTKLKGE